MPENLMGLVQKHIGVITIELLNLKLRLDEANARIKELEARPAPANTE